MRAMATSVDTDTVLWTLTKDGTLVRAVIREFPDEAHSHLRIFIRDAVDAFDLRGCPPGPLPEVVSVAIRKRDEMIAGGWVDATGMWPKAEPGD